LGDTWATGNLAKIDHVVVVMMENRSYDHVLGYIASPDPPASDGLSAELLGFLAGQGVFRQLRLSAITPNYFQLKTKFPASVGHAFADVEQQLSEFGGGDVH
jgi:phospholipase C